MVIGVYNHSVLLGLLVMTSHGGVVQNSLFEFHQVKKLVKEKQ